MIYKLSCAIRRIPVSHRVSTLVSDISGTNDFIYSGSGGTVGGRKYDDLLFFSSSTLLAAFGIGLLFLQCNLPLVTKVLVPGNIVLVKVGTTRRLHDAVLGEVDGILCVRLRKNIHSVTFRLGQALGTSHYLNEMIIQR